MAISDSSQFFSELRRRPEHFFIVHYSCQSLFDDNEGLSPRVTSIAVLHFGTGQAVSFSTHVVAEELRLSRGDVQEQFDAVETRLLEHFYSFVRDRRDKYWVHWNMRNVTYGFEHIEHRYRTLTGRDPPSIPVERRLNLNDILSDKYGRDYVPDPKMLNLMEKNGGRHRYFLTGPEEVQAFKSGEFIRMHQSTLCKVEFFKKIMERSKQGRLNTSTTSVLHNIDKMLDSRGSRLIAFISALIGVITFIVGIALAFW